LLPSPLHFAAAIAATIALASTVTKAAGRSLSTDVSAGARSTSPDTRARGDDGPSWRDKTPWSSRHGGEAEQVLSEFSGATQKIPGSIISRPQTPLSYPSQKKKPCVM